MSDIFSADYAKVVSEVISGVRSAQQRALLSVNRELVLLYWNVGNVILERAEWGNKFIENLSADIRKEFPELTGFSPRNLKNMRRFAEAYPSKQIVQQLVAQIPWGHILHLMERVSDTDVQMWYMQKCIENGWSRSVLDHQIATDLYKRQGNALEVSNFERVLPQKNVSALFKDPYVFDFLSFSIIPSRAFSSNIP